MPPQGNVLTTIVVHAETGRARDEVVGLLRDASSEASRASRSFADLTDRTQAQARAVADASRALADQRQRLRETTAETERAARERNNLKQVMDAERNAINDNKNALQTLIRAYANTHNTTDAYARTQVLATQQGQALNRAIQDSQGIFRQAAAERQQLNTRTQAQAALEAQLKNEITRLTAELIRAQQAQTNLNNAKKEAGTTLQRTNEQVRNYRRELNEIEKATRGATKEQNQLTMAHVAAANVIANFVTRAFDSLWNTIKNLIVDSTKYAARVDELGIALRNVAKITGVTQTAVFGQEASIKRLGITTEEARKTILKFAAAQLDITKSAQLARAAQDLAVIAGADSSETLDRLVHGITTLQIRVLRTAGVYISLQGALKAAAGEQNRSIMSFSEAEKQHLLLNATLDYAARATGTYEQAMANAGKQMRSMNRYALEAQAAFGKQFQGVFLQLVETLTELLKAVAAAPGAFTILGVALLFLVGKMALTVATNSGLGQSFLGLARNIGVASAALKEMAATQAAQMATSVSSQAVNFRAGAGFARAPLASAATPAAAAAMARLGAAGAGAGAAASAAGGGAAAGGGILAALGLTGVGTILAVVAAIGALIVILYKYHQASKEATFAKSEDIEITNRQIKVNREDSKRFGEYANEVRRVGAAIALTGEQRKEYQLALGRLNNDTANAIRQERDLAVALDKTGEALMRRNDELEKRRNRMTSTDIRGLLANQGTIREREALANRAEQIARTRGGRPGLERAQNNLFSLWNFYRTANSEGNTQLNAAEAQDKLNEALGDSEQAIERLSNTYRDMNKHQGTSIEQFLALEPRLAQSAELYKEVRDRIMANVAAQEEQERRMRDGTQSFIEFREAYEKAMDEMKVSNIDVSRSTEGLEKSQRVMLNNLTNSIKLFGDWRQAIGVNQQGLRQLDDDLAAVSGSQEEYNQRIAALDPLIREGIAAAHLQGAKAIERHGEAAASFARRLDDVNRRLRFTLREVQELNDGMGDAAQLELLESVVQGVRQRQQQILEARVALRGVDALNTGVGGTAEEQEQELRYLRGQLDIINAHRAELFRIETEEVEVAKSYARYQQVSADFMDTQVRTREIGLMVESRFNNLSVERLNNEKELTAEIRAQQAMRERARADVQGGLDADTRVAILRQLREQQDALRNADERAAGARARMAIRSGAYRGMAGLGELNPPGIVLPDPTRPETVFNRIETTMLTPVSQIATNTNNTVTELQTLNQRITQLVGEGTSGLRGSAQSGMPITNVTGRNSQGQALMKAGQILGVDPRHLAAIIGFETSGSYSPDKWGGEGGNYKGLIQFGAPERKQFNVRPGQTFEQQLLESVVPYFQRRFQSVGMSTQGASLEDLYTTVIAGNPRASRTRTDAFGTSARSGAARIAREHLPVAVRRFFSDVVPTAPAAPAPPPVVQNVEASGQTAQNTADMINREQSLARARKNRRFLEERFRLPALPTDEDEEVVRIMSNTTRNLSDNVELARSNMNALADIIRDVDTMLPNISNEFDVQNGLLLALADKFDEVRRTAVELEIVRKEDASGFFESEYHRTQVVMEAEIERRKAARDTRDEIIRLQEEIAHAGEGAADRIRVAQLNAMKEVATASERAAASQAANMVRLADGEVFHRDRVQSRYVEWAAQQKTIDDIVYEQHIGMMEGLFGVVDSGLDRITGKMGFAGTMLKNLLSSVFRFYASRAFLDMQGIDRNAQLPGGTTAQDAAQTGNKVAAAVENAIGNQSSSSVKQMFVGQLIVGGTAVTQGMAGSLSGAGGSLPIGGGGGNAWSLPFGVQPWNPNAGTGVGGTSVGGANGFGVFGTQNVPNFNSPRTMTIGGAQFPVGNPLFSQPGAANNVALGSADRRLNLGSLVEGATRGLAGGADAGVTPQAGGNVATSAAQNALAGQNKWFNRMGGNNWKGVKGFQTGIGAMVAQMLPGVGGSFGAMLGGRSMLGGIMGQVGGMALGGVGMAALMGKAAVASMFGGGAFGGAVAGLLTNPITAIVGGALLIGAFALGRNKRRREEEKVRDGAIREANAALDKLIRDVQRDRIDGSSALAQADEIRATYLQNMSQLKDSKTRSHALQTVREIDYRINLLKTAVTQQERRTAIDDALVPEFARGGGVTTQMMMKQSAALRRYASGGNVSGFYDSRSMGNRVPGVNMGYDSVLALVQPGEVVLNRRQQEMLRPALAMARIPGFALGGLVPPSVTNNYNYAQAGSSAGGGDIYIVADKKFAEQMAVKGRDKILQMSAADIKDEGILHSAVRKVK